MKMEETIIIPKKIVLPDVSLAAIVRDEMMNPSGKNPPGAIVDFVHSTVPFVEEAVIVDTGSKDGTRQALEELQAQYPQLRVFDRQFDDYASSRNYSLAQVRTKYALVLDADERIRAEDYGRLKEMMKETPSEGYIFVFKDRFSNEADDRLVHGHNPRLFLVKEQEYKNNYLNYGEYLTSKNYQAPYKCLELVESNLVINHFRIKVEDRKRKHELWYGRVVSKGRASEISPSDLPQSKLWKAYNPRREEFR